LIVEKSVKKLNVLCNYRIVQYHVVILQTRSNVMNTETTVSNAFLKDLLMEKKTFTHCLSWQDAEKETPKTR